MSKIKPEDFRFYGMYYLRAYRTYKNSKADARVKFLKEHPDADVERIRFQPILTVDGRLKRW